jgi:hypothetical protein
MPVWWAIAIFLAIGASVGLSVTESLLGPLGSLPALACGASLGALAAWLAFASAIPLWESLRKRRTRYHG